MHAIVLIRFAFFCCVLTMGIIFLLKYRSLNIMPRHSKEEDNVAPLPEHVHTGHSKCGHPEACPPEHFSFKIQSGVGNVIGPSICFDNEIVMSDGIRNTRYGINIAVIDGFEGKTLKTGAFLMFGGQSEEKKLYNFLKLIEQGMFVLVTSYDDPYTKMTTEIKDYFKKLGSSAVDSLKFRDSWVFVGTLGPMKSHFEKHMPSTSETNKYGTWPEVVEIDGCIPRRKA
uniref:protein FAM3D-like n=1 Tax=Myxine glutinosa TaxID=7769 RepID=UPI00358FB44A